MDLTCDLSVANEYVSGSQKARIIYEYWVEQHGYCLNCNEDHLCRTPANTKARDFFCPTCGHPYELKTKEGHFSSRVVDGEYSTMMERIQSGSAPSLFLLERGPDWNIHRMVAVHRCFLLPSIIEKRRPLSPTARRSKWVGCNILLDHLPMEGRVPIVQDGEVVDRTDVRRRFQAVSRLCSASTEERDWTRLVLQAIHALGKRSFALNDLYAMQSEFEHVYPKNKHIPAKVRQQLQKLRDAGLLRFEEKGRYQLL